MVGVIPRFLNGMVQYQFMSTRQSLALIGNNRAGGKSGLHRAQ